VGPNRNRIILVYLSAFKSDSWCQRILMTFPIYNSTNFVHFWRCPRIDGHHKAKHWGCSDTSGMTPVDNSI